VGFGRVYTDKADGFFGTVHIYHDGVAVYEMVNAIEARLTGHNTFFGRSKPALLLTVSGNCHY
jgi:hypothetical protein